MYDGNKNVYSSIKLPVGNEATAVEVELPEQVDSRAKKFTIKIKFAASIDMSCLEQVLKGEVLLTCCSLWRNDFFIFCNSNCVDSMNFYAKARLSHH